MSRLSRISTGIALMVLLLVFLIALWRSTTAGGGADRPRESPGTAEERISVDEDSLSALSRGTGATPNHATGTGSLASAAEREERLSRAALAGTRAHEVIENASALPRASLTALAALDAVARACDPEDLNVPVETALAIRDSRARNSSDAETRQVYIESLAIRRQFCGRDPAAVWNQARGLLDARAFTAEGPGRAPHQRFEHAFRMTADESLLDAAATLEALDAAPDLGYKSAAALPADMRAAVDRILRAASETGDPIMRMELLQRLTTHRAVAEAAGIFGSIDRMRQMDWVGMPAEDRRILAQQWAVEQYICRSMNACGAGSALGLRFIKHSPYAARGLEAFRRDQIPPLIWRQVDELARTIESQRKPRSQGAGGGGP